MALVNGCLEHQSLEVLQSVEAFVEYFMYFVWSQPSRFEFVPFLGVPLAVPHQNNIMGHLQWIGLGLHASLWSDCNES